MIILKTNIEESGYGKKIVLKNINLEIEQGKIHAFIGPNGAGKSTFLKAIIGLVKIFKGSVSYKDKNITTNSTECNVLDGISFIPQGNRIFPELSVLENLEVGGYLLDNAASVKSRINEVINFFPSLSHKLRQNAGILSGGEKQQLALARALMLKPEMLMLDEPSLGLSPALVNSAFDTIKKINQDLKTTILIVEQKVKEVLKIADKVYAMRMGEIVFNGSSEELMEGNKLREIFIL